MTTTNYRSRFSGADWFELASEQSIIIGGAGGIGSWTAFLLARMGIVPIVFDYDHFEKHNMGGQFVKILDVGKKKVEVLNRVIREYTGMYIDGISAKYTINSMAHDIMIAGFDNMQARKDMYYSWKNYVFTLDEERQKKALFIDGRLAMEQLQILSIKYNIDDMVKYEGEYLFSDDEVEEAACTAKQTTHAAFLISGYIASIVANHLSNIATESDARHIPFYYEVILPLMMNYEK